jgi:hypothetical protein
MDPYADPARLQRADRVGHAVSSQHHSDPIRDGWALNCEDGIVFGDAGLRAELKASHPGVVEQIEARRNFLRDELGIPIWDSTLPLSSTPYAFCPAGSRPDRCWRGYDGGGQ